MVAFQILVEQIDEILKEQAENEGKYYKTIYSQWDDIEEEEDAKTKVREDLLKLYIFVHSPRPRTHEGRKFTIKHSTGNLDINNYNDWFVHNMVERYCEKYIPEITSIEQAEAELQEYKKPVGRQPRDPRVNIIIYGIYRLFNEEMKMASPLSDSLCEFIVKFLQYLRLIDEDTHIDNHWIRAQVAYIKKKKQPPKYRFTDLPRSASSFEELKEHSRITPLLVHK